MSSVRMRQEVERKIADAFITEALKAGLFINIDNGGDEFELPAPTNDKELILKTMFATDEERLYVFKKATDKKACGWVFFVYGNSGYDVISDYTVNLGEDDGKGMNLMVRADQFARWYGDEKDAVQPE